MLTNQQLVHWETFGFVILRGLLTSDEVETARREFEAGLSEKSKDPEGRLPTSFSAHGPTTPLLATLPEDPRFQEAAEQMWGKDVVLVGSSGQRFTKSHIYWHPDMPDATPETKDDHVQGVKFAFYLEPLDRDTGALRVIPGSHKSPFHDQLFAMGLKGWDSPYLQSTGLNVGDIPSYIWHSDPSDVIAFNLRVWHASWGASADRRQCSVVYYKNPSTPREEELTRELAQWRKANAHAGSRGPRYDPHWLSNPEGSPTRQRWIEWLHKYGFVDSDPA